MKRLVSGTWRLLWSQQAENASPLRKWGSSQSKNYQVRLIANSPFRYRCLQPTREV
jgi:hypothetical protein